MWYSTTLKTGSVVMLMTIVCLLLQELRTGLGMPYSTLQSNEGGYGCAGTWNESYDASTSQKFWIAKIGLTEIPEFPVVLIAVASAVVAITVVGLSLYFKKRKH